MANRLRNLKLHFHRLMNTKVITLDGVRVHSSAEGTPKGVRSGLFKDTYEDAERALLQRVVQPGDRVLEIGGGIGVVGILATRLAGAGRVTSYEANPTLEPVIRANYALNGLEPDLRMRAVTVDGQPVTFHQSDNVLSSSLYARAEAGREIRVDSDALADVLGEVAPDVLVMDVEGAEIDLLADLKFEGIRAMVVELHPHVVGQDRIDALLVSLDERGFEVTERARTNVLLERVAA